MKNKDEAGRKEAGKERGELVRGDTIGDEGKWKADDRKERKVK